MNTKLSQENQKNTYNTLRTASVYSLHGLNLFEGLDRGIRGLTTQWVYSSFFRFMLEFESLNINEILICAAYHSRLKRDISTFDTDAMKHDLLYGRSVLQNKYNVVRPKNSPAWHINYEKNNTDLYFLIKSVFFFRYSASLVRLQTTTYKKRLRDLMDTMDFATIYEGVQELPKGEDKDKLYKLLTEVVPGFRVKYGRRDVSLKEYYGV